MSAAIRHLDTLHPLAALDDATLFVQAAFLGGRWITSETTVAVTDPATGETLGFIPALTGDDTGRAIDAAEAALPAWRALLPQERARILKRWNDLILASREDLALLMTLEQGKPLAESRGEIDYAASFVDYYAEEARRIAVEGLTSHLPNAQMTLSRVPLGVVGLVTPWNFPAAMLTRKAAAALAAGCTTVAHPSSETPFSALALAALAERAGMPAGVFNVVTGNAATIVGRLCEDSRVRAMSFTGSTEIGRLIAAQAAPTVKRLIMELGGHAPLMIFADSDLDRAVDIAMDAKFATSGQDCLAANRIYVERSIYEPFLAAFKARIEALAVGPGLDASTEIGPLMHARAIAKVEAQVHDAVG
ncbi:MAG: NAD-dependent succinate-semialdehyde dehydrogenase, partial [Aurantimonas sp.]|nr:NAD-dependent succinate-semialdehyde dehydrogenase [Aurantimonas sp.]